MIEIDCGGHIFKTTQPTLNKSTYFKSVLDRWNENSNDNSKPIFVDCDPGVFGHFLNLLRFAEYKIPSADEHNVSIICEYFGYARQNELVVINCSGVFSIS